MVELLHVPESHQDLYVHFRHRKHFYKNNSSQISLFVPYECTLLNHFCKRAPLKMFLEAAPLSFMDVSYHIHRRNGFFGFLPRSTPSW